jgi:hypothetical protein
MLLTPPACRARRRGDQQPRHVHARAASYTPAITTTPAVPPGVVELHNWGRPATATDLRVAHARAAPTLRTAAHRAHLLFMPPRNTRAGIECPLRLPADGALVGLIHFQSLDVSRMPPFAGVLMNASTVRPLNAVGTPCAPRSSHVPGRRAGPRAAGRHTPPAPPPTRCTSGAPRRQPRAAVGNTNVSVRTTTSRPAACRCGRRPTAKARTAHPADLGDVTVHGPLSPAATSRAEGERRPRDDPARPAPRPFSPADRRRRRGARHPPNSITVNGVQVIDSSGKWTGSTGLQGPTGPLKGDAGRRVRRAQGIKGTQATPARGTSGPQGARHRGRRRPAGSAGTRRHGRCRFARTAGRGVQGRSAMSARRDRRHQRDWAGPQGPGIKGNTGDAGPQCGASRATRVRRSARTAGCGTQGISGRCRPGKVQASTATSVTSVAWARSRATRATSVRKARRVSKVRKALWVMRGNVNPQGLRSEGRRR